MLEIYHLDELMAMLSMKRWLHPSGFIYLLDKTYSKSYLELLTHAQKYICIKEGARTWKKIDGKPKKKKQPWGEPSRSQVEKPNSSHR